MENMNKELAVSKWVLINRPKLLQNLSAQIVCPGPKNYDEQKASSVVRDFKHQQRYFLETSKVMQRKIHGVNLFQFKIFIEYTENTHFYYMN